MQFRDPPAVRIRRDAEHAATYNSSDLMCECLGELKMAYEFGAITEDDWLDLSKFIVRDHLNNAAWIKACRDKWKPKEEVSK